MHISSAVRAVRDCQLPYMSFYLSRTLSSPTNVWKKLEFEAVINFDEQHCVSMVYFEVKSHFLEFRHK